METILDMVGWDRLVDLFGPIFSSNFGQEVTKFSVAFAIAAWINGGRIKKIGENMIVAMKDIAAALRSDLDAQKKITSDLQSDVKELKGKVTKLEGVTI